MAKKVKESITLKEIAEELNDVMQYGQDEKGKIIDPDELIDVDMDEEVLLEEIKKRAAADLRPDDEQSFSPDAWDWFLDNGITPGMEPEPEPEPEKPTKGKASKEKEKAPTKGKADTGEKKPGIKKAMVPGGNEAKAMELAKEGCTLEDFIDEFRKIYNASGNKDETYIQKRAKIYYGLGYKNIGKTAPAVDSGKASKEKAPAKTEKPAGRGRAAAKEAPEPEDDAPKGRGRSRR